MSNDDKKKSEGPMKTGEMDREKDKYKSREEFISRDPTERENQDLDRTGTNKVQRSEEYGIKTKKGQNSNAGYDHPPQGADPYLEEE